MEQLILTKMKLMLNGWVNKERQEMEQLVRLKMHLMLNVPFLPGIPNTVAIPTIQDERLDNGNNLIRRQFPLMISWAYTIHKYQGKTLDIAIIYLGETEKCSGMTSVALSRVRKLSHSLLRPISIERFQKFNTSNSLPII